MVLSANDDFHTRELSIGELETAAGGCVVGGVIGSLPAHPHPHHPLPPINDILKDIPSFIGTGFFGFL